MTSLILLTAALAAEGASTSEPNYAVLGQYGVLGVFAVILIWFAKFMINRETARADRLEAEVLRLNNVIAEKVIPALMSATMAVSESTEMLRDHQRDMRTNYGRRPSLEEGR
jgi:hypothetical protein